MSELDFSNIQDYISLDDHNKVFFDDYENLNDAITNVEQDIIELSKKLEPHLTQEQGTLIENLLKLSKIYVNLNNS